MDSSFTRATSSAKPVKSDESYERSPSESPGRLLRRHSQEPTHRHRPSHSTQYIQRLENVYRQQESHRSAPTLERYLREDTKEEATRRGDREGYSRDGAGMASFLDDWQRQWDSMSNAKSKRGLWTACRSYQPRLTLPSHS